MIRECGILEKYGEFQGYKMKNGGWMLDGFTPRDQCNVYGVFGANVACNGYATLSTHVTSNTNDTCTCLQGFRPKNNRAWDSQEWWLCVHVQKSPL